MDNRNRRFLLGAALSLVVVFAVVAWQLSVDRVPPLERGVYHQTFDDSGSWIVGEGATVEGIIADGRLVIDIEPSVGSQIFWTRAGMNFADGVYEVEATPLDGTTDNGYGLLFRVDAQGEEFTMFKVSSDGYIMIGRCREGCAEQEMLVDRDWFASESVEQGLNVTNHLKVNASGSELVFYVNDIEVGRVTGSTQTSGDIGLLAETFNPAGLRVAFDNVKVTPLENE